MPSFQLNLIKLLVSSSTVMLDNPIINVLLIMEHFSIKNLSLTVLR